MVRWRPGISSRSPDISRHGLVPLKRSGRDSEGPNQLRGRRVSCNGRIRQVQDVGYIRRDLEHIVLAEIG